MEVSQNWLVLDILVAKFWYCLIAAKGFILTRTNSKTEIVKTRVIEITRLALIIEKNGQGVHQKAHLNGAVYSEGIIFNTLTRTNLHIDTDEIFHSYQHRFIPLNCLSLKHRDSRPGPKPPEIMFALCS